MSVIENNYPAVGKPSDVLQQHIQDNKNGYSAHFDNNNTTRAGSLFGTHEKTEERRGSDPTFLFWTLVMFIFILAVGNLILTFVILGVLRLGQGMESLELISEDNLIKFFGATDLDVIYKRDGRLEGFSDIPVQVIGDDSPVFFRLDNGAEIAPSIDIGIDRSFIQADSFQVRHPASGMTIFSTEYPNFGLPRGVETLNVQIAQTKRLASTIDGNLSIRSDTIIKLKGSEGTRLDGKEVVWSADQDIFLKSVNKSIILSGSEGVSIDVKRIPVADSSTENQKAQYKICVCMPSGRLFRVPVIKNAASCHLAGVSAVEHPCL